MRITQAVVEVKEYTLGDKVCFQTLEGPIVGDIESFDVHQRTFTLKTPEGTFVPVEENNILATIDSAPYSAAPQATAPNSSPSIGARTFQFNNYPGGATNVYDNSVTVNVGYGGNANLYFRSSTVSLPPPPPSYVKCTDLDKFWAIWAGFYQNNPNYGNYTGVPTTIVRPGTLITTAGNVQIIRN